MSAQANLLGLYQDWRVWTEAEREAIVEGDWRKVRSCQAAKAELQPKIVRQTEEAHLECFRSGGDRAAMEKRIRTAINELIYLESCNGEFIANQRKKTQVESDELNRSGRNLAKIQKHYASGFAPAWESYS